MNSRVENEICPHMSKGNPPLHKPNSETERLYSRCLLSGPYRKSRQAEHKGIDVGAGRAAEETLPSAVEYFFFVTDLGVWPLLVLCSKPKFWCDFSTSVVLIQSGILTPVLLTSFPLCFLGLTLGPEVCILCLQHLPRWPKQSSLCILPSQQLTWL